MRRAGNHFSSERSLPMFERGSIFRNFFLVDGFRGRARVSARRHVPMAQAVQVPPQAPTFSGQREAGRGAGAPCVKLAAVVMWRGGVPTVVVPEQVVRASPVRLVAPVTEDTDKMVVFPSVRGPVVQAPPLDVVTPDVVIECIDVVDAEVEQAQLAKEFPFADENQTPSTSSRSLRSSQSSTLTKEVGFLVVRDVEAPQVLLEVERAAVPWSSA